MKNKTIVFLWNKLITINPLEIFVIIVVIAGTVFVAKYFGHKPTTIVVKIQVLGKDWQSNYSSYEGYRPPFWFRGKIHKGDKEISFNGLTTAEVIDIEEYERSEPALDIYLTVKLLGDFNKKRQKFIFKDQPVETGAPIVLSLNNALVTGQIIDADLSLDGYTPKYVIATLRSRNLDPLTATNITVGDTIINGSGNTVVAQVLEKNVGPSLGEFLFTTGSYQQLFIDRNSQLVDVLFKIKLKVEDYSGVLYYGGHQKVKAGEKLWLNFPKIDLNYMETLYVEAEN